MGVEKKKILAVCGDSWLSRDDNYAGTHFTEILAERLDLKLISLAKQ